MHARRQVIRDKQLILGIQHKGGYAEGGLVPGGGFGGPGGGFGGFGDFVLFLVLFWFLLVWVVLVVVFWVFPFGVKVVASHYCDY